MTEQTVTATPFLMFQGEAGAAMDLYLIYRNASGDATVGGVKTNLDDLDMVIAGARIQF